VRAQLPENREHIYHAAMMDPHTAAELDLDQIGSLVDDLLATHGDWLPEWAHTACKVQRPPDPLSRVRRQGALWWQQPRGSLRRNGALYNWGDG